MTLTARLQQRWTCEGSSSQRCRYLVFELEVAASRSHHFVSATCPNAWHFFVQEHWGKATPRSTLTPTTAKEPKTLYATAQPAAILDEVVTFPIRIDLPKIHGWAADNATHELNRGALIVIHGLSQSRRNGSVTAKSNRFLGVEVIASHRLCGNQSENEHAYELLLAS
jgi:hypothetical protein